MFVPAVVMLSSVLRAVLAPCLLPVFLCLDGFGRSLEI